MQQYLDHRFTAVIHVTDSIEPYSMATDEFVNALRFMRPGECYDYGVIIDNRAGQVVLRRRSHPNWRHEQKMQLGMAFDRFRLACDDCDRDDFDEIGELPPDWGDLRPAAPRADSAWWNYLGLCPDCQAQLSLMS